jgi:hypothetical protein
MNMFRRLVGEPFRLGSTISKPTFRPTRQELLRPPTRSWLIPGVCHALPVAPGGLRTMRRESLHCATAQERNNPCVY